MAPITFLLCLLAVLHDCFSANVTTLPMESFSSPVERTVNVGIPTQHLHFRDSCHLRTPAGQDLELSVAAYPGVTDHSNFMHPCQVALLVSKDMGGSWVLYAESGDAENAYVVELPFLLHIEGVEDENAAEESATEDQYTVLSALRLQAAPGSSVQVRVPRHSPGSAVQSCRLATPAGQQLDLLADPQHPGLAVLAENLMSACLVEITASEAAHGNWSLYSRETSGNVSIECEQPFQIEVTEAVDMQPAGPLAVERGRDLLLRLARPVPDLASCSLLAPQGQRAGSAYRDARYADTCAFVVPAVTALDSGVWEVRAAGRVSYSAEIAVSVTETQLPADRETLSFTEGQAVSAEVGPSGVVFCQLRDPQNAVVWTAFDGCRLELAAVERRHHGAWSALLGLRGALALVQHTFQLTVHHSAALGGGGVSSRVEREGDAARLSCSALTRSAPLCAFVRPDSTTFVAQDGVGEGRYSACGGAVNSTDTGYLRVECGLCIETLTSEDLGSWRCLLESDDQVLSSFLRVNSGDVGDLAVVDENGAVAPVEELQTSPGSQVVLAGQEAVLTCSVRAHLQYCWFRAPNNTVISLSPGVATELYEYSGSGLESGECALRIRAAHPADSGTWTCNVGVEHATADLSVPINITVYESPLVTTHAQLRTGKHSSVLVLVGATYDNSPLDYCRFVTPQGFGFNTESSGVPARYSFAGTTLSRGLCHLTVVEPSWPEYGTWTVAGRPAGGAELTAVIRPVYTWTPNAYPRFVYCLLLLLTVTSLASAVLLLTRNRRRRPASAGGAARGTCRGVGAPVAADAAGGGDAVKRPGGAPPAYDAVDVSPYSPRERLTESAQGDV